ncbi:hypothetical protein VA596_23240 [Amycolatopsis sp., V23-08]|uniref:Transposase n=1 Tax=Amycolatopsis heterodermiae TaxID=3110235 RepID=A0ABU5R8B6_9PSEU|nr:hypothetical protein [Amycolatopsis sp., V23-08]MEA5362473.1 hypothetical protein [Amycolatopsis sp., V23-08]
MRDATVRSGRCGRDPALPALYVLAAVVLRTGFPRERPTTVLARAR